MKKLIPLLFALFALCGYARAEELAYEEIVITEPRLMQQNGDIMLFSAEPSVEEQLYSVIEEGLCAHAEAIDVSAFEIPAAGYENETTEITVSEMFDIYCTAVYNHPEYGDLRTGLGYTPNSSYLIINIYPIYLENYYQEEYDRIVDYTLSRVIAPGMTDTDKLLAIHDYLADKITYSSKKYVQTDRNGNPIYDDDGEITYSYDSSVFTPYGALVNCDAVCQGYSLAFKLLCDRAGITCGYAVTKEHMWNIVELDGSYYHVDVTWDDQISGDVNYILHKYFLISDKENTVNRSAYSDYTHTSNVGSCDDSSLHSTLYAADKIDPFQWRGDCFWYEGTGILVNNSYIRRYSSDSILFKFDGNAAAEVTAEEYLPYRRLDAELFPAFDGKTAIDGPARQKADLYSAAYDADGTLAGVTKVDVTFDSRGRAVVPTDGYSKLMLLSDNGLTPLAYPSYS